jgi:hypothetical protein
MKGKHFFVYVFCFVSLYFSIAASAQMGISGRVYDAENKSVLNGVIIKVKNAQKSSVTDNSGYFHFQDKIELPCTLEFSVQGYNHKEIMVQDDRFPLEILLNKIIVKKENVEFIAETDLEGDTLIDRIT